MLELGLLIKFVVLVNCTCPSDYINLNHGGVLTTLGCRFIFFSGDFTPATSCPFQCSMNDRQSCHGQSGQERVGWLVGWLIFGAPTLVIWHHSLIQY